MISSAIVVASSFCASLKNFGFQAAVAAAFEAAEWTWALAGAGLN